LRDGVLIVDVVALDRVNWGSAKTGDINLLEIVHEDFIWAVDDGCKAPVEESLEGISTTIRDNPPVRQQCGHQGDGKGHTFLHVAYLYKTGNKHLLATHRN